MKVVIFGAAGLQGTPMCFALNKLGHTVVGVDTNKIALHNNCSEFCEDTRDITPEIQVMFNVIDAEAPDMVVSCLPYIFNTDLAFYCIESSIKYTDLGGHIQTSQTINDFADEYATSCVFTDLGLAPGLVNIIAEYLYNKNPESDTINMYCGGLPEKPLLNMFNYGLVFSAEGLVNEYFNDCDFLNNGQIVMCEPVGDLEVVKFNSETLEAFNTSGAAHTTLEYFKSKGVKNCYYKTMRYPGHNIQIRKLLDYGLTNKEIQTVIERLCPKISRDVVYIKVQSHTKNIEHTFKAKILPNSQFTAMQRSTAFPAAVVVDSVLRGMPSTCYNEINYQYFFKRLLEFLPEIGNF